ncbi:MAG: 50S ribosomal protein L29 [Nitrospirae bacterium]|nr:MAG: 50S ribosomal protein L29 [Nitrospirota bacterium]
MKYSEIKEMTIDELNVKVDELKRELFNLRFQKARGELENPRRIKEVKKDIARILTRIREMRNG